MTSMDAQLWMLELVKVFIDDFQTFCFGFMVCNFLSSHLICLINFADSCSRLYWPCYIYIYILKNECSSSFTKFIQMFHWCLNTLLHQSVNKTSPENLDKAKLVLGISLSLTNKALTR